LSSGKVVFQGVSGICREVAMFEREEKSKVRSKKAGLGRRYSGLFPKRDFHIAFCLFCAWRLDYRFNKSARHKEIL
jgi:hypothetical protein